MKKIRYNSWLAKNLLWEGYTTITIAAWVFTTYKNKEEMSQCIRNHECVHARQWVECAVASAIIIWLLMILFDISCWWMLLSLLMFYILYGLEYIIKRWNNTAAEAYEKISFEREARLAENDNNYLENGDYFNWINFINL